MASLPQIQHVSFTWPQPSVPVLSCPVCGSGFAWPVEDYYSGHPRDVFFQHAMPQSTSQHYSYYSRTSGLPLSSQVHQIALDCRSNHTPPRHTRKHDEPVQRARCRPTKQIRHQPSPPTAHRQRSRLQPLRQSQGQVLSPPPDAGVQALTKNLQARANVAETDLNLPWARAKVGMSKETAHHSTCNLSRTYVPLSATVKDQVIESQTDTSPERLFSSVHNHESVQQTPFVLWIGNVPSNATTSELLDLFSALGGQSEGKGPTSEGGKLEGNPRIYDKDKGRKRLSEAIERTREATGAGDQGTTDGHGIMSINLMTKSSCAFVNYSTSGHLLQASRHFNNISLRPKDLRYSNLVCRIRSNGGREIHSVVQQHEQIDFSKYARKHEEDATAKDPLGERSMPPLHPFRSRERSRNEKSLPSTGERKPATTGPTGPLLQTVEQFRTRRISSNLDPLIFRHDAFKERFFILKSFGESELEYSVAVGRWKTQKHNVAVLNEAFRNSESVFLIFGANQSGRFFGYARMTGPIPSPSVKDSTATDLVEHAAFLYEQPKKTEPKIEPAGPSAVSRNSSCHVKALPSHETNFGQVTGKPCRREMFRNPANKHSQTCPNLTSRKPETEEHALCRKTVPPTHAMPNTSFSDDGCSSHERLTTPTLEGAIDFGETNVSTGRPDANARCRTLDADQAVNDTLSIPGPDLEHPMLDISSESEGQAFALTWISTMPMPFGLTGNLRNAWKANVQIKVSRDGTELEPSVGRQLLADWRKMSSQRPPECDH